MDLAQLTVRPADIAAEQARQEGILRGREIAHLVDLHAIHLANVLSQPAPAHRETSQFVFLFFRAVKRIILHRFESG